MDGNLINFNEFSNTAVDNEDAVKMNNFSENFAVSRDGIKIAIERRNFLAAALREQREGVARFRVTIGPDGRVRNCEITASSGSPDLDRATCANVAKRARFKPAIDASGATVSGSYASAVKWQIPD